MELIELKAKVFDIIIQQEKFSAEIRNLDAEKNKLLMKIADTLKEQEFLKKINEKKES